MNIKQIRELAQIVKQNGLTALEVSENDTRIRLECSAGELVYRAAAAEAPAAPGLPLGPVVSAEPPEHSTIDFNRLYEVKAALVGVFYAAPAPNAAPFVQVGSRVKKGDVLCVIEAMKLMNDITSDRDGEVVDVCVANGEVVEFGQTLFKLC